MRPEGPSGGAFAYGDAGVAKWATADEEATAVRSQAYRHAPDAGTTRATMAATVQATIDATEGRTSPRPSPLPYAGPTHRPAVPRVDVAPLPTVLGVQAHAAAAVLQPTVGAEQAKERRATVGAKQRGPAGARPYAVAARGLKVLPNPCPTTTAVLPTQEADTVPASIVGSTTPVLARAEEVAVVAAPTPSLVRRRARGLPIGCTTTPPKGADLRVRANSKCKGNVWHR